MDNCIFCKIIKGEIPSRTLYENDSFKVIMDVAPAGEGHSLIISKQHAKDIFELSDDKIGEGFALAKKVGVVMKEKLGADGINILQNNGRAANQTVDHFHIHVVPRKNGEEILTKYSPLKLSDSELDEIKNKITFN